MAKKSSTDKPPQASGSFPVKRSALRVLVLSIVSLGLYTLYWFYITRTYLNEELGKERSLPQFSPAMQTFGPLGLLVVIFPLMIILIGFLFLPLVVIASVVVWFHLLKDISRVREKAGLSEISPGLYIAGYVALNLAFGAGVAILALTQSNLNEYWDKKTNGKAVEAKYSGGEIVVTAAGLVLLTLLMVLIFAFSLLSGLEGNSRDDDFNRNQFEDKV